MLSISSRGFSHASRRTRRPRMLKWIACVNKEVLDLLMFGVNFVSLDRFRERGLLLTWKPSAR